MLSFDWEVLDVIAGGKSAIDSSQGLRFQTHEDVNRFLKGYGYDLENPIEQAELFGNFQEAVGFIKKYFLYPENPDGMRAELPRKLLELTEIAQLFLYSSGTGIKTGSPANVFLALWSCAVVKVMHTIAHMDKDLRSPYFPDIQTQIMDRFYKFIHNEDGKVYLSGKATDPDRVNLVLFETKPKKSRDSVLLKLLHKPENVAEDIFDRVGIRFVTKNIYDSLRVIRFLKNRNVISAANIKPSRSRNTLIDTELFKNELHAMDRKLHQGEITLEEFDKNLSQVCEKISAQEQSSQANPHTSEHYKSIQFTGRQLIKFKNPLYDELKALKAATKGKNLPEELSKITDRLDLRNLQKEIRFFYPFEVQVTDERNHQESLAGKSSHTNYKKNQLKAAMKRVLGSELLRLLEADSSSS